MFVLFLPSFICFMFSFFLFPFFKLFFFFVFFSFSRVLNNLILFWPQLLHDFLEHFRLDCFFQPRRGRYLFWPAFSFFFSCLCFLFSCFFSVSFSLFSFLSFSFFIFHLSFFSERLWQRVAASKCAKYWCWVTCEYTPGHPGIPVLDDQQLLMIEGSKNSLLKKANSDAFTSLTHL